MCDRRVRPVLLALPEVLTGVVEKNLSWHLMAVMAWNA
jgi:hypothetical protein